MPLFHPLKIFPPKWFKIPGQKMHAHPRSLFLRFDTNYMYLDAKPLPCFHPKLPATFWTWALIHGLIHSPSAQTYRKLWLNRLIYYMFYQFWVRNPKKNVTAWLHDIVFERYCSLQAIYRMGPRYCGKQDQIHTLFTNKL